MEGAGREGGGGGWGWQLQERGQGEQCSKWKLSHQPFASSLELLKSVTNPKLHLLYKSSLYVFLAKGLAINTETTFSSIDIIYGWFSFLLSSLMVLYQELCCCFRFILKKALLINRLVTKCFMGDREEKWCRTKQKRTKVIWLLSYYFWTAWLLNHLFFLWGQDWILTKRTDVFSVK